MMKTVSLLEFLINWMCVVAIAIMFPQTLIPIAVLFGVKEGIEYFFTTNYAKFFQINDKTSKIHLNAFAVMRLLCVALALFQIWDISKNSEIFLTNGENQTSHKWDHLDPLIDSLRSCIKFCGIPCALGVLQMISTGGIPLNFVFKIPCVIGAWYVLSQEYYILDMYSMTFVSFVLYGICLLVTLYDVYVISTSKSSSDPAQPEEKSKILPPKFEMRNLTFHVYEIAEYLNLVRTSDVFLIFLIVLNANFITMAIYLAISTFLSSFEKQSVFSDANWTHIIFKLIHFGLFLLGNHLLQSIPHFYGEEETIYGNTFLFMILVLITAEIVRIIFLFNSKTPRFSVDWVGKYLVYMVYLWFNFADLQQFKFFMGVSVLTQVVSTVSFAIFVILKK